MRIAPVAAVAAILAPGVAFGLASPEGTGYRVVGGRTHPEAPPSMVLAGEGPAWRPLRLGRLPDNGDRLWIELTIEIFEPRPSGLYLSGLFSSAVYWDGQLIGENGAVESAADDATPGQIDQVFAVPRHLTAPGDHRVLIHIDRSASQWRSVRPGYAFVLGDLRSLTRSLQSHAFLPLVTLGALGLVGLFTLALGWQPRAPTGLRTFGWLCLAVAALLLLESWRGLFGYPYPLHVWRLRAVLSVGLVVGALLPLSTQQLLSQTAPRAYTGLLLGFTVVVLVGPSFDARMLMILGASVLFSFVLTVRAWRRGRINAGLYVGAASASVVALVVDPFDFLETGFFIAFGLWVAAVLFDISGAFSRLRDAESSAQLRTARLELELLRRHMRPHFLMNVLNAVSDWVETDPPTAVRFIEALGTEFRALIALADRPLVPLVDELALCRSFLEVMGYREDRRFELEVAGHVHGIEIPPGILHTLIENGVTHGAGLAPTFRIDVESTSHGWRLTVRMPYSSRPTRRRPRGEGTGHRFIIASLYNAFGDHAHFEARVEDGLWVSRIERRDP